jgi:hypothetical protein
MRKLMKKLMIKRNKLALGIFTIVAITIISTLAIRTINKTQKEMFLLDDINWDI